jgi:hypothetical protein
MDKHLSDEELDLLKKLNNTANKLSSKKKTDLFDKSLNTILNEWAKNMADIFHDLSVSVYVNKYIKESENLYEFASNVFIDVWDIFTKESRAIYIGFTIILISIVIYFINVTS